MVNTTPNLLRFGDLEGDTIIGKNRKGAIETIIYRHTGFLWMSKLSGEEGRTRMQTDSLGNTSLKDLTLPKCPTIILQRYKTSSTTDQERDWDSGLLLRSLECYILNIFNMFHTIINNLYPILWYGIILQNLMFAIFRYSTNQLCITCNTRIHFTSLVS